MFSRRSQADLETLFVNFVFGSFQTLPRNAYLRTYPSLCHSKQRQISHYALYFRYYSGIYTELVALMISACNMFISKSISWENLAFHLIVYQKTLEVNLSQMGHFFYRYS